MTPDIWCSRVGGTVCQVAWPSNEDLLLVFSIFSISWRYGQQPASRLCASFSRSASSRKVRSTTLLQLHASLILQLPEFFVLSFLGWDHDMCYLLVGVLCDQSVEAAGTEVESRSGEPLVG